MHTTCVSLWWWKLWYLFETLNNYRMYKRLSSYCQKLKCNQAKTESVSMHIHEFNGNYRYNVSKLEAKMLTNQIYISKKVNYMPMQHFYYILPWFVITNSLN